MLFDTQSPNRRRFVQVTFAMLAILMGGGLVLFGIGSNTGDGGLADALNSGQTIDETAKKNAEAAEKVLAANPKDEAAAAKLAKARVSIASQSAFDANGQVVEDGGATMIAAADNAWTKYLALGPARPDGSTAILFSSFYASPGVQQYDKAARALEAVLVTRKPSSGLYAQLALYALASGNADKAKEAKARAIDLATSPERAKAIEEQLDQIEQDLKKQQEAAAKAQEEAGGAGGGSTTPTLPTLPTLQ
ncbi:MAG: hypothetical protein JHD16_13280 [Solirubrobacteraceae bacterium]|nr:hypothetical protein [Solirubrobacteraceae bacterium]